MTLKELFRGLIFLFLAFVLFVYLNNVFTLADSYVSRKIFNGFYAEVEDTLDGVYIGSSSVYRFFAAPYAFEKSGMAIYTLGVPSKPFVYNRSIMEEVMKTQNPDLFLIELRWFNRTEDYVGEAHVRNVCDSMRFLSLNRIRGINDVLEYYAKGENDLDYEKINYYFPIVKYHTRWQADDFYKEDLLLTRTSQEYKGFCMNDSETFRQLLDDALLPVYTEELEPLTEASEECLKDFLDYCDSITANVVFTLSPFPVEEEDMKHLNQAMKMVSDRGYQVINCCTEEAVSTMGLDWKKDFYDEKHVNIQGAEKFTDYIVQHLQESYDMKDHRDDPAYKSWKDAYEIYLNFSEEKRKKMEQ